MCFVPQRDALFRHLNFKKRSEREVFLAFSLANVLRATTACTFSTSQLPKVVRTWCALYILTWKCASRHNGVQFFISHLASWLCTRRFSEPTFQPSGATNHWKNTVFRNFPTFSRTCIFFLSSDSFSSLLSSALLFSILLLHLCFSSVHIVGSLTSKLPLIMHYVFCIMYFVLCIMFVLVFLCFFRFFLLASLFFCFLTCATTTTVQDQQQKRQQQQQQQQQQQESQPEQEQQFNKIGPERLNEMQMNCLTS